MPFIEALPRFGLVADPNDEHGLPIGMSAGRLATAPNNSLLVGVSCAACHSGQYTYQGTAMTIDGAPNMLNFEALLTALTDSVEKTVSSPRKLFRMLHAMMEWEASDRGGGRASRGASGRPPPDHSNRRRR